VERQENEGESTARRPQGGRGLIFNPRPLRNHGLSQRVRAQYRGKRFFRWRGIGGFPRSSDHVWRLAACLGQKILLEFFFLLLVPAPCSAIQPVEGRAAGAALVARGAGWRAALLALHCWRCAAMDRPSARNMRSESGPLAIDFKMWEKRWWS